MLTSIAKTETIAAVLLFLLLWSVLFHTTVYPSPESDVVSLSVSPNVQAAPGTIKLKILVAAHQDNIQLCVGYRVYDYPEELTERRSCQQLNGIYSPRVYWMEYKNIPTEQYIAFATVTRVPNRLAGVARASFTISPN